MAMPSHLVTSSEVIGYASNEQKPVMLRFVHTQMMEEDKLFQASDALYAPKFLRAVARTDCDTFHYKRVIVLAWRDSSQTTMQGRSDGRTSLSVTAIRAGFRICKVAGHRQINRRRCGG